MAASASVSKLKFEPKNWLSSNLLLLRVFGECGVCGVAGWEARAACGVCGVFASEDVGSDEASMLSGFAENIYGEYTLQTVSWQHILYFQLQ